MNSLINMPNILALVAIGILHAGQEYLLPRIFRRMQRNNYKRIINGIIGTIALTPVLVLLGRLILDILFIISIFVFYVYMFDEKKWNK